MDIKKKGNMEQIKKEDLGINVKKEDDFSEWYTQIIQKGDLADYSLVSGCIIFKPTAYALWENIKNSCDERFKKIGIKNVYFPLLIPESLLKKESTHLKGFSPEVAWVTEAGNTKLSERLAIRPTSETIMYNSYSKWIRSWKDLPLRYNQWNNVVRWEFNNPVPFLRTREFLWNEGHTVFATKTEAEAEGKEIMGIYDDVLRNYLALPSLIGKKSTGETFAGAEYTLSCEHYLPNGKAIQGPDFHHDGQIFAKAYDIKFLNKEGKEEYAYQNTFAISTRNLGIMLAMHSDNRGVVIPPKLAPNKVVVIPILFDDSKQKVLKKAREIYSKIEKFSPIIDDREDYSAGWKYNEWELKGIPIRLEIGPKDIEIDQVILVRRDTLEKKKIKIKDISKEIEIMLEDIQKNLYKKAEKLLKGNIEEASNFNEVKKALENKKLVYIPWCEEEKCAKGIKEKIEGVKPLNSPLNQKENEISGKKCALCGKPAKKRFYFGKSY